MNDPVRCEEREAAGGRRIGIATLDAAPRLNALSMRTVSSLRRHLARWQDDERIAVAVLHAASDKAFCAGGDLRELYAAEQAHRASGADGRASAYVQRFFEEEYRDLSGNLRFWLVNKLPLLDADGDVFLRTRAGQGLLAQMTEPPVSDWTSDRSDPRFPLKARWDHRGQVVHVFTHFRLELEIWSATVPDPGLLADGWWADPRRLDAEALPTVFRKALATAGLE